MKRSLKECSIRDEIMSSKKKRETVGLLLEELSKPELDIPSISAHTSLVLSHINRQNMLMAAILGEVVQKKRKPIVLEIRTSGDPRTSQQSRIKEMERSIPDADNSKARPVSKKKTSKKNIATCAKQSLIVKKESANLVKVPPEEAEDNLEGEESGADLLADSNKSFSTEGKQFEIIFADSSSTRPNDMDNDDGLGLHHHIIHSITERTSAEESNEGTVNVPNSFPLFQLVHTGEVPEEMQREIAQKIRQANPELDINSITFKFKSPETVEIIANLNT